MVSFVKGFISHQPDAPQLVWDSVLTSIAGTLKDSNSKTRSAARGVLSFLVADSSMFDGLGANEALGDFMNTSMEEYLRSPEEEPVKLISAILSSRGSYYDSITRVLSNNDMALASNSRSFYCPQSLRVVSRSALKLFRQICSLDPSAIRLE